MQHRQSNFTVILRKSIIALMLAAGLLPVVYAGEAFYALQPQAVSILVPEAPAPLAL